MPKNIKILPSGRVFTCEGNSTLLEAGLHAGLALDYGCSNGNCGQCLAKIISGEVKKVCHHDYSVSEEKRLSGHVLMCSNTALTDITLEALEAGGSNEIPRQQITARVRSLQIINNKVALLHLKTPRTNRLRFLAGQNVQLGGGDIPAAQHPISSCPCDDMNLHFQIPMIENDAFSDHVFGVLEKGDHVEVNGPMGDFVLNEASSKDLVFIAWQTGFAPIKSLIEHAMALELTQNMHLIWIGQSRQDHYQDNLCRSWRDAFDNFNYVPVDAGINGEADSAGAIFELLNIGQDDLPNHEFYIAGSDTLIKSFQQYTPGVDLHIHWVGG